MALLPHYTREEKSQMYKIPSHDITYGPLSGNNSSQTSGVTHVSVL